MTISTLWFWFVALPAINSISYGIGFALIIIGIFGGVAAGFSYAIQSDCRSNPTVENQCRTYRKSYVILMVLLSVLTFATRLAPNDKQALLLAGGYYAINNEEINKLPNNIAHAANAFFEKYALPVDAGDDKK